MISGWLRWQRTDGAPTRDGATSRAKGAAEPDVALIALTRDTQADAT